MRHLVRWFAYHLNKAGEREAWDHKHWVREELLGYDVECSCGWTSHTGGASELRIKNMVKLHKAERKFMANLVCADCGKGVTEENVWKWNYDPMQERLRPQCKDCHRVARGVRA